jgi:hypothetical protein
MTSTEAAFSITRNFHTVRGSNLAEFKANVEQLLGEGSYDRVAQSFQEAFGVGDAAAQAAVRAAFPGTTVVTPPVSTVGGVPAPLPAVPQPAAAPASPSAFTGGAPINPKTGQPFTKLVPAGVSKKTGKPYQSFWAD